MGSGLVYLAAPRSVLAAALTITPELVGMFLPPAGSPALIAVADKCDAIVIGPGLGQSSGAAKRVAQMIRLHKPMVIDADALNILARGKKWPGAFRARAVLTPHPGEMKRLIHLIGRTEVPTDDAGRIELAATAAAAWKVVVVLKGHRTVITDGRRVRINSTGDSSLSKGGSGDILSGMIASLLGLKMDPFEAASLAVHLHGLAGEIAGKKLGRRSVLGREVIDAISAAIRKVG